MLDLWHESHLITKMALSTLRSRAFAWLILTLAPIGVAMAEPVATPELKKVDFEPKPAIWKLSDSDTTIYLFGTIHILPKTQKWQSKLMEKIIADTDELVIEHYDKDENKEFINDRMADQMIARIGQKSILDRVLPENKKTLRWLMDELKLSKDYLDLLPTWQVAFEIDYSVSALDGITQDNGVETVFIDQYKKANKPVSGIEDGDAVFLSISALSDADQLVSLDQMLTAYRTAVNRSLVPTTEAEKVSADADNFAAWANGEADKMAIDTKPENIGKAYYKALILDRNKAWSIWLKSRMQRPGKLLLAVGSAHLAGPDSVLMLLKAQGMTAERIQ